jgi:hypothetical protein
LCTPPNIIKVIQEENEMGRTCGTYAEEKCIQGFGGEASMKEYTWNPYAKWEDNIKMDAK